MTAPTTISEMVERFTRNRSVYTASQYNETQLRREFLDPFFEALGWDMQNRQGYAEPYKDVVHEDALKIGGATKAPDYAFRIGGTRKFFVEAKKPSVRIREDAAPAYQLRRYAWSAKLPLSILTDFEEFAVYDCRVKPDHTDGAAVARVLLIPYTDYPARWDEIAGIFAREAILKGSFDQYAQATAGKRGTAEVDTAFLQQIEQWRADLAHNLALRNPGLTARELNFAVQRTIDRLIFLRICEDRGIEEPDRLRGLTNGLHVYERLCDLFRQADMRYNSGLFHFHAEEDRGESPDTLTLGLAVDDRLLRDLIKGMYYPESPYEFSVLPADILGQVYEQFLGKVIRLTPGHQAKVEEKPAVRKAGGVYYTPTYIVDYIVRQTVGRLVEGKTPRQVAGAFDGHPLRVADPACGSGSFLIGAYQFLLDWHRDWYIANLVPLLEAGRAADSAEVRALLPTRPPARQRRRSGAANGNSPLPIYLMKREGQVADWRLTTAERKRILLAHIFGVDIDAQAVEVTKMSLLLKVLEGENEQTLARQMSLFQERALPDLGSNIQCGNSLIGPDFYDNPQMALLPADDQYRVNVFDWRVCFAPVFTGPDAGFDAVIGNPPYIRIQTMKEEAPQEVEYYKRRYAAASKGNYDIYVVFVEKGLKLLNSQGKLGFILPHKFFNAQYGEPLRGLIAEGRLLDKIVHFGDQQVFHGATTYTCLFFLNHTQSAQFEFIRVLNLEDWSAQGEGVSGALPASRVNAAPWNFNPGPTDNLREKLAAMPTKLGQIATRLAQGIRTSANEIYVLQMISQQGDQVVAHSETLGRDIELERAAVSLFLQGREIKRYRVLPSGKVVLIPYTLEHGRAQLISEPDFASRLPKAYTYLTRNRTVLENRENGRMRVPGWYGFVYPKNIEIMKGPKILVPDIADRASFALDESGAYAFTSGYGITLRPDLKESTTYVLGLLNSRLLDFYLKGISTTMRGGFFRYFTQFIEQLPIRTIDFSSAADKIRHDRMAVLVEQMVQLYKTFAAARTDQERKVLERQIAATDRQIDQLVYELYGLTAEEIAMVEGGG